jgi:hypothetical protein
MPIYKTKNENFFKTWSGEMAYVLGFFTADGAMYKTNRGTHFIEFQITDGDLLLEIQKAFGSNHKITNRVGPPGCKLRYRLQIGCKEMFNDLLKLGLMQNKSKVVHLPMVPEEYFGDFLRGYFDGDGHVTYGFFKRSGRKGLARTFLTGFTSGSYFLLKEIKDKLADVEIRGSLCFTSGAWRLSYSNRASKKLFHVMYHSGEMEHLIFLERKYRIFERARGNAGVV